MSTKGQIVIPRNLREVAGLAAGVRLVMQMREDGVIEIRSSRRRIDEIFGMLAAKEAKVRSKKTATSEDKKSIMDLIAQEDDATRGRRS
jgi:bifunctional DNA-binding transcriptional regulator/antitoxin component of YhaV-PrlF toxin-antitoxin module